MGTRWNVSPRERPVGTCRRQLQARPACVCVDRDAHALSPGMGIQRLANNLTLHCISSHSRTPALPHSLFLPRPFSVPVPSTFSAICNYCRQAGSLPSSNELVGGECKIVDPVDSYYVQEMPDGSYALRAPDYAYDQTFNLYAAAA